MKTWIMMRHGKSSWELQVSDADRPLNERGINDAHRMGAFLATKNIKVDAAYASPANRAAHTALIVLKELDLPKGSRVGLYSNKQIDQVVAILAILSTDYILVPLTTLLKSEQVEYIIQDCDIKCIITDKVKIKSIEKFNFEGHLISFDTTDKQTA